VPTGKIISNQLVEQLLLKQQQGAIATSILFASASLQNLCSATGAF
jgi:hypothetical protein